MNTERLKELGSFLPAGFMWGDTLQPAHVEHIVTAALSAELARRPAVVSEGQAVAHDLLLAARAEGRAEAVEIISGLDPEDALGDCTSWSGPVGPEDEGSMHWDIDALRAKFHANDGLYDAFARAESMYWDYYEAKMTIQYEAEQRRHPAAPAPEAPQPLYDTNTHSEGRHTIVGTLSRQHGIAAPPMEVPEAPTAAQASEVSYIDRRTEQIRLSHANADSKGKIQLRNEVECLLAHIALLKSERAAPVAEAKMLPCPDCGTDRLKDPCPRMADECAMVADAHLLAVPVAEAPTEPGWTAEEICNACVKSGLGILQCDTLMTLLNGTASPALLALLERVAAPTTEQAKAVRRATDAEVEEWVARHDIGAHLKGIDARAAFEDAESLHMTFDAAAQASPAKPDLAGLTALHKELGQMKWMGSDAGWDLAIDAVRKRIESLLAAITVVQATPKGSV